MAGFSKRAPPTGSASDPEIGSVFLIQLRLSLTAAGRK
jgi:hypothetical protein